jgi:hypothetical protein
VGPKPKPQETEINKGKNIDVIVEDELEGTRDHLIGTVHLDKHLILPEP